MIDINDLAEQAAILQKHEGFIARHAHFWASKNSFVEFDDLMQEGRMALLYAAKRADGRGSLLTYAVWYIRRAMRAHVMAFETPVRLGNRVFSRVSELGGAMKRLPLDKPTQNDPNETLADRLMMPEPEEQLSKNTDLVALVETAMLKLKPQQQAVLKARFIDGRKLREVAADYGLTRERIRQIESKALRLLRADRTLKRA